MISLLIIDMALSYSIASSLAKERVLVINKSLYVEALIYYII
jgi:hypothetical protein